VTIICRGSRSENVAQGSFAQSGTGTTGTWDGYAELRKVKLVTSLQYLTIWREDGRLGKPKSTNRAEFKMVYPKSARRAEIPLVNRREVVFGFGRGQLRRRQRPERGPKSL
jgi:hypothetical protein